MTKTRLQTLVCLLLCLAGLLPAAQARINASQVAVIVNLNDPDSLELAQYYQQARGIPDSNIIQVRLPATSNMVGEKRFREVYRQVKEQTPDQVQFYALAWSRPFKAGCMSITAAFTFGFDSQYCAKGCMSTRRSVYFDNDSSAPYSDHGIRPSMMLAGSSLAAAKLMIDRGLAADATQPSGTAYLVSTSDRKRNVRARSYELVDRLYADRINIEIVKTDALRERDDVLFYFTGLKHVDAITSNRFVPGAMADHLTSAGGRLFVSKQMDILKWLDAGATASYGTVVEPCAYPQKFPDPLVAIKRYTNGESLVEAYWKSVAWPGQGIFVGEPMATPYLERAAVPASNERMAN